MLITLFAVIIALLLDTLTPISLTVNNLYVSPLMITGGVLVLITTLFLNTSVLSAFGFLEQQLAPNLTTLFRHDKRLYLSRLALFLFPLISFGAAVLILENVQYQQWLFLAWLVLFGVALDLLHGSWERIAHLLSPKELVNYFTHEAIRSVQLDHDEDLWQHIDDLSEIALRSVETSKLALSTQTIKAFPPIVHSFFDSSKSISRFNRDKEVEEATGRDEASYTIFYLLQRLELINDKALQNRLETVCRQMVMTLGKIIVYAAKFDLSMVSFPTHFLTKFGLKAQQHHFEEVAVLTTSTLIEIAKTITTDVDLTYAQLEEPFRSIINGLDALAKGSFKKDKQTNVEVLIQPFLDIKALFETEKLAGHKDTPAIVREINRVIEEYQLLDKMMRGIPPIE